MKIWLVMKTATGAERTFAVRDDRVTIGRSARSDIRVPITSVAPRHCELIQDEDGLRLIDLDSREGTLVNGTRVEEAKLEHRDQVTIGPVNFEVRFADPAQSQDSSITEVKGVGPLRTESSTPSSSTAAD